MLAGTVNMEGCHLRFFFVFFYEHISVSVSSRRGSGVTTNTKNRIHLPVLLLLIK